MHRRASNWDIILDRELRAAAARPFAWGHHDCCLAAMRIIDAMTGTDLLGRFAGTYTSEIGAARVLQPYGGIREIADAVAAEFGWHQVPVLMAQRGDAVLADVLTPGGQRSPALGILGHDGTTAHFAGPQGFTNYRLRDCSHAWHIG